MHFENYKNTLIPVERVMWVNFDTEGDWSKREPRTLVHIFLPNGFTQAIEFKGNQVNKINEWLKQFPDAGSCACGPIPSYTEPNKTISKGMDDDFLKSPDGGRFEFPYPKETYVVNPGDKDSQYIHDGGEAHAEYDPSITLTATNGKSRTVLMDGKTTAVKEVR